MTIEPAESALIARLSIEGAPSGAPCFDGHFPDDPITPGAVLLGHAARALRDAGTPITGVSRIKFLRPLPPETPFEITIARRGDTVTLSWIAEGETIAQAKARLG